MSKSNNITILSYDNNADRYIANTAQTYLPRHATLTTWIDSALNLVQHSTNILEIGSATNRDANYMRSKGYTVRCTDAASDFVSKLKEQGEADAVVLNPITDQIIPGYGMIFANAVIPHFTITDLHTTLKKIFEYLPPKGIFAFNVKMGAGQKWIHEKFEAKRFIHYWQPNDIEAIVRQHGFDIPFFESGIIGEQQDHIWIRINAQKK